MEYDVFRHLDHYQGPDPDIPSKDPELCPIKAEIRYKNDKGAFTQQCGCIIGLEERTKKEYFLLFCPKIEFDDEQKVIKKELLTIAIDNIETYYELEYSHPNY